jgi:hypothetical protein
LNTSVSEEYYPTFCGPLTKEEILGTPAKKELAELSFKTNTQRHTLAATERPERTRQH